MFKANQNLLVILMLNLLYPAVLGSIFYSVLGNLQAITLGRVGATCLLMMTSVVILFSIDFLYTAIHERYRPVEFLADLVILVAMFNAFDAVNFLVHKPAPEHFCFWLGITFCIFVIWDIPRWSGLGPFAARLVVFEIFLALFFLIGSCVAFPIEVDALVAILASLIIAALFTRIYRVHQARTAVTR